MKIAEQVTFAAGQLDRAADIRGQAEYLAKLAKTARILPLWRGKPLMRESEGVQLGFLTLEHPMINAASEKLVFLGRDHRGPVFAVDLSAWEPESEPGIDPGFIDRSRQHLPDTAPELAFAELRGVMAALSPIEAEIAATARSILEWHRIHGFCANCGAPTLAIEAGWQRHCEACDRMHFPRTDPVVIMLVTHGNSVLIGRGVGWPEGMYSLLAGFMEPGETLEAATRREVLEETGVKIGKVSYLASQPWPYPSSLMVGTWGEALSREITLDQNELHDAIWMTREEMLNVFSGSNDRVTPARNGSIAHFLLRNWLADRLD